MPQRAERKAVTGTGAKASAALGTRATDPRRLARTAAARSAPAEIGIAPLVKTRGPVPPDTLAKTITWRRGRGLTVLKIADPTVAFGRASFPSHEKTAAAEIGEGAARATSSAAFGTPRAAASASGPSTEARDTQVVPAS